MKDADIVPVDGWYRLAAAVVRERARRPFDTSARLVELVDEPVVEVDIGRAGNVVMVVGLIRGDRPWGRAVVVGIRRHEDVVVGPVWVGMVGRVMG